MNVRKWMCKAFGHKWGNRGIINSEEKVVFTCTRCGKKQARDYVFVDSLPRATGRME